MTAPRLGSDRRARSPPVGPGAARLIRRRPAKASASGLLTNFAAATGTMIDAFRPAMRAERKAAPQMPEICEPSAATRLPGPSTWRLNPLASMDSPAYAAGDISKVASGSCAP
jgi:hypothetical protein